MCPVLAWGLGENDTILILSISNPEPVGPPLLKPAFFNSVTVGPIFVKIKPTNQQTKKQEEWLTLKNASTMWQLRYWQKEKKEREKQSAVFTNPSCQIVRFPHPGRSSPTIRVPARHFPPSNQNCSTHLIQRWAKHCYSDACLFHFHVHTSPETPQTRYFPPLEAHVNGIQFTVV